MLHGDVAPVQQAVIHLGTRIFPNWENLAIPEMAHTGTAAPIMDILSCVDRRPVEGVSILTGLAGDNLDDSGS